MSKEQPKIAQGKQAKSATGKQMEIDKGVISHPEVLLDSGFDSFWDRTHHCMRKTSHLLMFERRDMAELTECSAHTKSPWLCCIVT